MNISKDKQYRTRDGREVRIYAEEGKVESEARIEQLEADNARLETERGTLRGMYNVATQRNQQLEAALHFYADDHEYPSDGPWGINSDDFGNAARAAIKAGGE